MNPLTPQRLLELRRASHRAALEGAGGTIWIKGEDAALVLATVPGAFGRAEAWSIRRGPGSADGLQPVELRAWARALDALEADTDARFALGDDVRGELMTLAAATRAALDRPRPGATMIAEPGAFTPESPRPFTGGLVTPGRVAGIVGEQGPEFFLSRTPPDLVGANAPIIDPGGLADHLEAAIDCEMNGDE